jgi:hypothetical protein
MLGARGCWRADDSLPSRCLKAKPSRSERLLRLGLTHFVTQSLCVSKIARAWAPQAVVQ